MRRSDQSTPATAATDAPGWSAAASCALHLLLLAGLATLLPPRARPAAPLTWSLEPSPQPPQAAPAPLAAARLTAQPITRPLGSLAATTARPHLAPRTQTAPASTRPAPTQPASTQPAPIPPAPTPAPAQADAQTALATLTATIRRAVQQAATYPQAARQLGREGRAQIQFDYTDGRVSAVTLAISSHSTLLDTAALRAIRRAALPRAPACIGSRTLTLLVWVDFSRATG